MKPLYLFLLLILSAGPSWARKPFENALIFPGGGYKMGMHLAAYHALVKSGINPDLLIGTCGGSISAAIIERYPYSLDQQLDFLLSREFHKKLLQFQPTKYGHTFRALETILLTKLKRQKHNEDFLRRYLLDAPQDLEVFGEYGFSEPTRYKNFSTIIQSVEYNRASEIPFQQVYFTDPETGSYLADYQSSLSRMFSKDRVKSATKVISSFNLNQAVRSSISDPYLMDPYQDKDTFFLTGAIDVLPLDLSGTIAENTFYFYENDMPKVLDSLFQRTFGSSMMEKVRRERKTNHELIRDIDLDDSFNMDPKFTLGSGITSTVPEDYIAYKKIMKGQYESALMKTLKIIEKMKPSHSSEKN